MLPKATIKHLNELQQKKHRAAAQEFIVEGVKGVEEALENGEVILIVIDGALRDEADMQTIIKLAEADEVQVEFCGRKDIGEIKTTDTFPGVLAVVSTNDIGLEEIARGPIVALDGVKDPGNLGTIIRTADWFGITNILLAEDSVDPYNPKVVRSTMGSIFRTRVFESLNLATSLQMLKEKFGYTVVSLEMDGEVLPQKLLKKDNENVVFLFGSESHGVRESLEKFIDSRYTIPGKGQAESLNVAVAAAIVMSRI